MQDQLFAPLLGPLLGLLEVFRSACISRTWRDHPWRGSRRALPLTVPSVIFFRESGSGTFWCVLVRNPLSPCFFLRFLESSRIAWNFARDFAHRCGKIDTAGARGVAKRLKRIPRLSSLDLSFEGCASIDYFGASAIAMSIPEEAELEALSLNFKRSRLTMTSASSQMGLAGAIAKRIKKSVESGLTSRRARALALGVPIQVERHCYSL